MRCCPATDLLPFRDIVDSAIRYVFRNLENGVRPVRMFPSLPGPRNRPVCDVTGRRLRRLIQSVHINKLEAVSYSAFLGFWLK